MQPLVHEQQPEWECPWQAEKTGFPSASLPSYNRKVAVPLHAGDIHACHAQQNRPPLGRLHRHGSRQRGLFRLCAPSRSRDATRFRHHPERSSVRPTPGRPGARRRRRLAEHRQGGQARRSQGPHRRARFLDALLHQLHPHAARSRQARSPLSRASLVVIGVHSPKFDNEKKTASIGKAILRYEIKHPVVNDADHKIWDALRRQFLAHAGPDRPRRQVVRGYAGEGKLRGARPRHRQADRTNSRDKLKDTPIEFKLGQGEGRARSTSPARCSPTPPSKRLFIADSTDHRIVITSLEGKKIAIAGSRQRRLQGWHRSRRPSSAIRKAWPSTARRSTSPTARITRSGPSISKTKPSRPLRAPAPRSHSQQGGVRRDQNRPQQPVGFAPGPLQDHDGEAKKIYVAMAGHHQIWTSTTPPPSGSIPMPATAMKKFIDGPLLEGSAFAQPCGLATDGKHLFVADSESSSIRSVPLPGVKGRGRPRSSAGPASIPISSISATKTAKAAKSACNTASASLTPTANSTSPTPTTAKSR